AFPRLHALLAGVEPGAAPIDFSIGEPKHAPPAFLREILDARFGEYTRYPPVDGTEGFRDAVRAWLTRRYALPAGWLEREAAVLPLNGTREGLFMSILATTPEAKAGGRPAVLLPNPFYQCYAAATLTAQAEPVYLSVDAAGGHLPDLDLDPALLERCSAFFMCSPSNPQGAVASKEYWRRLLELSERYDFVIFADECYSEIYRRAPPPGVLQVAAEMGADPNRVLAFHSLSKRSNLAGLRSGFVAGGPAPVAALKRLKAYGGAPCPLPAIHAAEAAWRDEPHVEENRRLYAKKFEIADALFTNRQSYESPEAGFFLWIPVEDGEAVAKALWRLDGLKTLPGAYLSRTDHNGVDPGRGFVRAALVDPVERVEEGLQRLAARLDALD
ncbi:MAG: aminotransferase class I/II-fold pyridoxal phosphate-dependent enzyme, partial [Pseudomonadota bacterium]